jgi:hypothetical protein
MSTALVQEQVRIRALEIRIARVESQGALEVIFGFDFKPKPGRGFRQHGQSPKPFSGFALRGRIERILKQGAAALSFAIQGANICRGGKGQ